MTRKAGASSVTGLLSLVLGATGIGFAPIFVRYSELGPFATAAHRLLLASPLIWVWWQWEKRTERLRRAAKEGPAQAVPSPDLALIAVAGACFAGDMALWNWSLHLTTVANSTLITNLTPLVVMIAARVLFKEPITRQYLTGLPLALLGVALLVQAGATRSPDALKGDLLSALATLTYAGYLLALRKLRITHSPAGILFKSGLVACALLFLIAWLAGEPLMPWRSSGWLPLLALAWVSHVGGQGLIAHGFGYVSAATGSLVLLVQPVVATILAWAWLGERLSETRWIGAVLALAGIAIASRRPAPPQPSGQQTG